MRLAGLIPKGTLLLPAAGIEQPFHFYPTFEKRCGTAPDWPRAIDAVLRSIVLMRAMSSLFGTTYRLPNFTRLGSGRSMPNECSPIRHPLVLHRRGPEQRIARFYSLKIGGISWGLGAEPIISAKTLL
jgi:hypothetical protein